MVEVDGSVVVVVVVVDDVVVVDEDVVVVEVLVEVVEVEVVVVGPALTLITTTESSPTRLPAAGACANTMSAPKSSFGSVTSVTESPAFSNFVRAS